MRVNAMSCAVGVERGALERHLHLQGYFVAPVARVAGAVT